MGNGAPMPLLRRQYAGHAPHRADHQTPLILWLRRQRAGLVAVFFFGRERDQRILAFFTRHDRETHDGGGRRGAIADRDHDDGAAEDGYAVDEISGQIRVSAWWV